MWRINWYRSHVQEGLTGKTNKDKKGEEKEEEEEDLVPTVEFPFKNINDGETREKLPIIAISAPFRTVEDEENYAKYKKKGLRFLGISSYMEFPEKLSNPFEDRFHEERNHDYLSMVSSWVHCFRNPSLKLLNSGLPIHFNSEADMKNIKDYTPDTTIKKEYDFIYLCLNDSETECKPGWQSYNRNWDLAKKCLVVMCRDYQLKVLIIGRKECEFTDFCKGIVKVIPDLLPFVEFQKELQKCRFLFVPNIADASPRVITECMCYNIPVLVNYNILGGWHNVIPYKTGEFFTDENNVSAALDKLLTNYKDYQPREWFIQNRGLENSGAEFADFLKKSYPQITCGKNAFI